MYANSVAIVAMGVLFCFLFVAWSIRCFEEYRRIDGILSSILAISILVIAVAFAFDQLPVSHESTEVTAMVTAKEYKEEFSRLIPIRSGKMSTYIRRHSPEKFLITLTYQNITDDIDNQDFYNAVNEGDWVNVYLITTYNWNQRIIRQEFSLLPK